MICGTFKEKAVLKRRTFLYSLAFSFGVYLPLFVSGRDGQMYPQPDFLLFAPSSLTSL